MVDVDLEVRARVGGDAWGILADGPVRGDSVEGLMGDIVSTLRDLADAIEAHLRVTTAPTQTSARLHALETQLGASGRG